MKKIFVTHGNVIRPWKKPLVIFSSWTSKYIMITPRRRNFISLVRIIACSCAWYHEFFPHPPRPDQLFRLFSSCRRSSPRFLPPLKARSSQQATTKIQSNSINNTTLACIVARKCSLTRKSWLMIASDLESPPPLVQNLLHGCPLLSCFKVSKGCWLTSPATPPPFCVCGGWQEPSTTARQNALLSPTRDNLHKGHSIGT